MFPLVPRRSWRIFERCLAKLNYSEYMFALRSSWKKFSVKYFTIARDAWQRFQE
jgi:hypothetical protein